MRHVVILVAPVVAGLIPAVAGAGGVAPSARSSSLAIPGEFLDAPDLLHQYPELACTAPSQMSAYAADFSVPAFAAMARTDRSAYFFLSQAFSGVGVRTASNLLQAGVSSRRGPVRLGLAVRGSTDRRESSFGTDYSDQTTNDRLDADELRESYVEGAVGLGIGEGSASFADLVLETYRETFEVTGFHRDFNDTLEAELDAVPRYRFAVAFRGGLHGPRSTRFRVVGGFQSRTTKTEFTENRGLIASPPVLAENYGHRWSAGLAVSGTSQQGTRATVHALYRDERGPGGFVEDASSQLVTRSNRRQEASFGISLERGIWYDVTLLAGLRSSFTVSEDGLSRTRSDGFERSSDVDEMLRQQFAWGLQRRFDSFDITGSMRADLALADLFVALDVTFLP